MIEIASQIGTDNPRITMADNSGCGPGIGTGESALKRKPLRRPRTDGPNWSTPIIGVNRKEPLRVPFNADESVTMIGKTNDHATKTEELRRPVSAEKPTVPLMSPKTNGSVTKKEELRRPVSAEKPVPLMSLKTNGSVPKKEPLRRPFSLEGSVPLRSLKANDVNVPKPQLSRRNAEEPIPRRPQISRAFIGRLGNFTESANDDHNNNGLKNTDDTNFLDFVDGTSSSIKTELVFTIKNVPGPIGVAVLPVTKQIVICATKKDEVMIFDQSGNYVKNLDPVKRPFRRPSAVAPMPDGRVGIRDDKGILLFDDELKLIGSLVDGILGRIYGLVADGQGHLVTVNTNPFGNHRENPTQIGGVDVLFIHVDSNTLARRVELAGVIDDVGLSKCRFLRYKNDRLYIVDLGLDRVYELNKAKMTVRKFGQPGKRNGQFADPAGIVVDNYGNTIVADSRNHRLQIFDKSHNFVGLVAAAGLKRPSEIFFNDADHCLYVLNLWGNSMFKLRLVK